MVRSQCARSNASMERFKRKVLNTLSVNPIPRGDLVEVNDSRCKRSKTNTANDSLANVLREVVLPGWQLSITNRGNTNPEHVQPLASSESPIRAKSRVNEKKPAPEKSRVRRDNPSHAKL